MLQQTKIIELLQKEEERGVCWRLRLGEVPVWPLIRICAYLNWRGKDGAFSEIPDSNLCFLPENLPDICVSNPYETVKKKILYISRADGLTDKVNGLPFDRFISSMMIFTESVFDVTIASANPSLARFDDLTDFSDLAASINKSELAVSRGQAETLQTFLKNFSRKLGFDIEYSQVTNMYIQLCLGRRFWGRVLDRAEPDLVISTCFYVPDIMGACAAAFQRNIKFVDVQHGRVGLNHPAMAHWNFGNAEPDSHALFPREFWCWEKRNVDQIKNTWKGHDQLPIPIEFGNPWRYIREQKIIAFRGPLEEIDADVTATVLIALQPFENSLPVFFIEALKFFERLRIWIRPHPHQRHQKQKIRSDLRSQGLKDFSIRDDKDLYEEFRQTDILVTAFSTVATEARDSQIPVILTHENAPVAFGEEIDNETIFYCWDSQQSQAVIEKLIKHRKAAEGLVNYNIEKMLNCF